MLTNIITKYFPKKISTMAEIKLVIIEICTHFLTPNLIRSYLFAPIFCPQYVAIVTPKVVAGCITNCNTFEAAA